MGLFSSSSDEGDSEPTFSDKWEATPEDGVQQWEYRTIDLREQVSGFFASMKEDIGDGPGPSEELMNELGKDGWELVETVEGSADDGSVGHATTGSKTNILIFKRPVSYSRKSESEERGEE